MGKNKSRSTVPRTPSSQALEKQQHSFSDGEDGIVLSDREVGISYSTTIQLIFILFFVITGAIRNWFDLNTWLKPQLSGADKILSENPLIDGHNDLLIAIRALHGNRIYNSSFAIPFESGNMTGQFDLKRADKGRLGGAFWSAWVPCPGDGFDFSTSNYYPFVRATLEQIDLFNRLAERYPKYFTLAHTAEEAERNFENGKLISPLAIEGLHQIGNSLSTLRLYHSLGVRYATLTWNCHNIYADAAVVSVDGVSRASSPYWHGINPTAGRALIYEMNRLGMIVDLSHVSVNTMRDVLIGRPASSASTANNHTADPGWTGSLAPPIFSHSSAYALCPHPRNVPDEILQLVRKRRSVVMINFAPDFISCRDVGDPSGIPEPDEEHATLERVVEHIMHIGELIGYDYVGVGSDFDGIPAGPRGLEDVSKYPDLFNRLLAKGVSEKDVSKVAGRNLLRVWKEVDKVAARLQKTMLPTEDAELGKLWLNEH